MNPYEVLLMFDAEVPDERQGEVVARMRELVEKSGGTWIGHEPWGRRKLAYEIDHKGEGVYHLASFDVDPATLDELSRVLRITDGVIRHLPTRRPARATELRAAESEPDHEPAEAAVGTAE
ncbi:MAG: 30S ribosomal protein S6 [Gaiellaceae bacterium]